jgi:hypothetical protein
MGFLDRAKKLAEQAKGTAEGVLAEVRDRAQPTDAAPTETAPAGTTPAPAAGAADARLGTPYVPGMLGRPGWRERGLVDPAAVLPIAERDRAGVPRSTKSVVLEEPFGMGRRWSIGERSAALFYQLYDEHRAWTPPGGTTPSTDAGGAATATLPDGRSLVFLGDGDRRVVLEVAGLDSSARADLARAVVDQLAAS